MSRIRMQLKSSIALLCVATIAAGAQFPVPVFPTRSYFKTHLFSHPTGRVELKPPVRIDDRVVDGKIELSLRAYLDLVMANSPDIEIQRLNVETRKNAIERAFGIFDPFASASFSTTRTKTPATDLLSGAAALNTLSQPANFSYQQKLETGTSYSVGFFGSKFSTNSAYSTYNPAISSQLSINFSQPLLRNRGSFITKLPITIARSTLRQSEYTSRDGIIQLIYQAENDYWQLVQDRENLRVNEEALKLNDASLQRARKEQELGAASPLDIFQPEADYASAQIAVSQAKYQVQQSEDRIRKQIGADLEPKLRTLPIVLTEPVLPPANESPVDAEQAVAKALRLRPDLKAVIQSLDVDELNIRKATNGLRPDLSLTGNYVTAGRGGTFYQRSNVTLSDGTTGSIVSTMPGGFGDALNQMFGFGFPVYSLGITLRLPIRDHSAQADLADSLVAKRIDTLSQRSLEKSIRQGVLNAVSQLESSKAAVKLAVIARDLAQKVLDAEQKKYDLGVTQIFFVLDAQRKVATANSVLVTQSTSYRRSLLNLLRLTGELLDERGITIQ